MKLYCINARGLLDGELTVGRGYWPEMTVHEKVHLVNNTGYKSWYDKNRFTEVNPNGQDGDDSDVKIWKEKE